MFKHHYLEFDVNRLAKYGSLINIVHFGAFKLSNSKIILKQTMYSSSNLKEIY